jgi:predicted nuclease with TOPRIM domain
LRRLHCALEHLDYALEHLECALEHLEHLRKTPDNEVYRLHHRFDHLLCHLDQLITLI